MIRFILVLLFIGFSIGVYSQTSFIGQNQEYNVITTAVPFLSISPDSRSGGMGDAGVATPSDVNSILYNAAKYNFNEKEYGVAISYVPWLKGLGINDIHLLNLSGFGKIGERQVISGALHYFSLGDITFTDEFGEVTTEGHPNEFQLKAGYSRLLLDRLSLSVSLGFVYSDLSNGQGDEYTTAGTATTADIGMFYNTPIEVSGKETELNIGFSILNIGNKMSYSSNKDERSFLPTTLKLGSSWLVDIDDYNSFMFTAEMGKLLVPTPPIYYSSGDVTAGGDTVRAGNKIIQYGNDPKDISVGTAMFTSWNDAPGTINDDGTRSVMKEEWKEFTYSVGVEYWYAKQFALRAGYFHESQMKGNRKFYTVGLGLKLNTFGIDFSYLIAKRNNPLENTLRFSLLFEFGAE